MKHEYELFWHTFFWIPIIYARKKVLRVLAEHNVSRHMVHTFLIFLCAMTVDILCVAHFSA